MMMLKYSLSVFCFLLAGYSCASGHKETKTSAETETTCTDSMCAGLGDTSPEGTASDCTSLAHTDSINADSIYTSPSQKNESASTLIPKHQKSPMALYMDSLGLINIAELDNSIAISLMYTKADNFTGEILYDDLSEAYLHPHAAYALLKAQEALKALHPSYSLIIYDAARPMSVQRKMWDVVKGTSKYRYVSNPNRGGGLHNYGLAVDISIQDSLGRPLPMGTKVDHLGVEAHITEEGELIRNGKITKTERQNRILLRLSLIHI